MYHFVFPKLPRCFPGWRWKHVQSLPPRGKEGEKGWLLYLRSPPRRMTNNSAAGPSFPNWAVTNKLSNCSISDDSPLLPGGKKATQGQEPFFRPKILDIEIATVVALLQNWWCWLRVARSVQSMFSFLAFFRVACYLLQHSPVQHVIWSSRVVRSCIRVWRLVKSCIRVWMLARSSKRHKPGARCAFIYNRIQLGV